MKIHSTPLLVLLCSIATVLTACGDTNPSVTDTDLGAAAISGSNNTPNTNFSPTATPTPTTEPDEPTATAGTNPSVVSTAPSVAPSVAPIAQSIPPSPEANDTRQLAPESWYAEDYECAPKSMAWSDVNDWFYQLQADDYKELADSKYDLLVIDGDPPFNDLNKNVVNRMKCGGDGEKFMVSYISVGQAEEYRDYWQPDWEVGNPSWIVYADVYWLGDYFIEYWNPTWEEILLARVDKVVDKGFDGLYLDVIDAYAFFGTDRPTGIEDMRQLIEKIALRAKARSGNPDFGIFVQNAEELIEIVGPTWIEHLTGLGKEEPFFWAMDSRVDRGQRFWNDHYLSQWVDAGKLVLNVDYVLEPDNIAEVYAKSRSRGYVPLTLRQSDLAEFEIVPGYEPD